MPVEIDEIADVLIIINGILLLLISLVFLRLYFRYRKRNYLLLTMVLASCALQMIFSEIDALSVLAVIFGFIMILLILAILLFPERMQFDFEETLIPEQIDLSPEDD
ncbi:MAG: hypothetical protein ACFFB3_11325 [Candidatus Hodarchaeota archaeon]